MARKNRKTNGVTIIRRSLAEQIVDETTLAGAEQMRREGWEDFRGTRMVDNVYGDGTFMLRLYIVDYTPTWDIGGLVWDNGQWAPGFVVTTNRREAIKLVQTALEAF